MQCDWRPFRKNCKELSICYCLHFLKDLKGSKELNFANILQHNLCLCLTGLKEFYIFYFKRTGSASCLEPFKKVTLLFQVHSTQLGLLWWNFAICCSPSLSNGLTRIWRNSTCFEGTHNLKPLLKQGLKADSYF